jgi:hypothetical protein
LRLDQKGRLPAQAPSGNSSSTRALGWMAEVGVGAEDGAGVVVSKVLPKRDDRLANAAP